MCILAGGITSIANGVIATLNLRIAPDAKPGSFHIRLDQGLAILKDLQRIPIEATETEVTVLAK